MLDRLKQSGVSLIEILITTLILGVGLLGVAALQVSSISSNQEGFFTSQATSIAEDLASRIRSAKVVTMVANDDNRLDYAVFLANYVNPAAIICAGAPATMCRNDGLNDAENCTLAQIAAFDMWEICTIARNTLPQGRVLIANLPAASRRLSLVVDWDSAAAKTGIGKQENINKNCVNLTGNGARNCIIMELLP